MPGNSVRQQALKELLDSGADVDLEFGDFHPNDVATLLKTFLGELPEPLLTHRQFHVHLKIAGRITHTVCHLFPNTIILIFRRHFNIMGQGQGLF